MPKIALVDDDRNILTSVSMTLEAEGFDVETYNDGQSALDAFNRFYSERPANDFGNNFGLGLAISKQFVEAHDGAIWAENIRPTQMDATSAPLGARFVVGLLL